MNAEQKTCLENIKATFDEVLHEKGSTNVSSYDPQGPSPDGVKFWVGELGDGTSLFLSPRSVVDNCLQGTTHDVETLIRNHLADNPKLIAD